MPVCSLCHRPIGDAAHDHIDTPHGPVTIHYLCAAMLDALPEDDGGFERANPLPWERAFDPAAHALSDTSAADDIDLLVVDLLTRGAP